MVKIVREMVKIVQEKIPTWLNYLNSSIAAFNVDFLYIKIIPFKICADLGKSAVFKSGIPYKRGEMFYLASVAYISRFSDFTSYYFTLNLI